MKSSDYYGLWPKYTWIFIALFHRVLGNLLSGYKMSVLDVSPDNKVPECQMRLNEFFHFPTNAQNIVGITDGR